MPAEEPREIFPTRDKEEYGSKNHEQEQLSVQIVTPPYSEAAQMPYDVSENGCHVSWKNVIIRGVSPD
ncbi:hypothetical protein IG631_05613 [Alternaria alternata]|nr:hypothetical protein IG631_05613 [Alternaria alternata]